VGVFWQQESLRIRHQRISCMPVDMDMPDLIQGKWFIMPNIWQLVDAEVGLGLCKPICLSHDRPDLLLSALPVNAKG